MEAVVTTGAVRHANLQSDRHHIKPTPSFFYRPVPFCCPTNSVKVLKGKYHVPRTGSPQAHLGTSSFVSDHYRLPVILGEGCHASRQSLYASAPILVLSVVIFRLLLLLLPLLQLIMNERWRQSLQCQRKTDSRCISWPRRLQRASYAEKKMMWRLCSVHVSDVEEFITSRVLTLTNDHKVLALYCSFCCILWRN